MVNQLLNEHPYWLFIFSNRTQDHWHFINVKYDEDPKKRRLFRRISVSPEERLRTASERIAMLDLQSIQPNMLGLQPLTIQSKHDEAFDVEAVTKQFFEEYKAIFRILEDDLKKQANDHTWAHDYSLQFLNRCMFIYFIQRKGWLGNDYDFLINFWRSYQRSPVSQNSFVDNWLKVLFFEAFNNKFHGGHNYLPAEIGEALSLAPYLNGGLFTENKFDQEHKADITDRRFEQILKFLERYNFTIEEDSPLDKEVAVDPEMIGKVYESLVNVSDEIDERGEAGIFYTPRTEIDLMCRLSLVDHLANHLGEDRKELLYQLIFALEPDEKTDADKAVAGARLWYELDKRLQGITLLDPACGSGSFLVGMLNILDDLQERANRQLGVVEGPYERKKRIIGQSLYGVDVMEWACHVAELRLWLALIIDAEIPPAELHVRKEPLLPHFTFKIRQGDSLVQEIGGVNFGHRRETLGLSRELKKRIDALKDEKLKFYNNDKTGQFYSLEVLKQEERNIFQSLLEQRIHTLENEIKTLNQRIATPQTQMGMIGLPQKPVQAPLDVQNWKRESEQKQTELVSVRQALNALHNSPQIPFVWDIAFVEIFESEKEGFDIVIGNPPYVRQGAIAAPVVNGVQVTTDKKEYNAKLALSVYQAFPRFFGYKASSNTVAHKINGKSDLYIYFYLHGLSLLNDKGSFCFITSNSWLDVGYGADLQEFLLKHSHVKMVLDNQMKRSFKNADVNTVIALFSAPDDSRDLGLEKIARFVMFRVPFEHIVDAVIFDEIEEATERKATKEYRVFPIQQAKLLEDGCEIPEEEEVRKTAGPLIRTARYIGNKWGGKYLRAPDIYWTILEKGKGKLVSLGDIAEVRRGFTSGANGFFYLDAMGANEWSIEHRFLRPLIKGPKDIVRYQMKVGDITNFVFYCQESKAQLRGTNALRYIEWGENQSVTVRQGAAMGATVRGFNRLATLSNRNPWYALNAPLETRIFLNKGINDRHFVALLDEPTACDQQIYQIKVLSGIDDLLVGMLLNSTMTALFAELIGRCNFGGGVLWLATYEVGQFPVIDPRHFSSSESSMTTKLFPSIAKRKPLSIALEVKQNDRRAYDDFIASIIGLTQGEQDALYEAVINLVEARLKKAGSV